MIPYEDLTRECLAHGVMPAVVPQLKTITLGGAVAGVGIESSSHRYGLVHDTMLELDVLLGDGRVVGCTPDNAHADLFFGFPNSYGTLGYALRVKAKTVPVKPYVRLSTWLFRTQAITSLISSGILEERKADFIDGTIFSPERLFLTLGASSIRRRTRATTPSRKSTTARSPRSARTTWRRTTTSGAGTPTGSGARRTCSRRTP